MTGYGLYQTGPGFNIHHQVQDPRLGNSAVSSAGLQLPMTGKAMTPNQRTELSAWPQAWSWSAGVRTGPVQLPMPIQWTQCPDALGEHDSSSSRPAGNINCFVRGWKAQQVRPLSWPSFVAVPGSVNEFSWTSSNRPLSVKPTMFQNYQNHLRTPSQHSSRHQGFSRVIKGLSPNPAC